MDNRKGPNRGKRTGSLLLLAGGLLLLSSCLGGGQDEGGLAATAPGTGPTVRFDPLVDPAPEIPFPNDLAAVQDTASQTGLRVNVSADAPTAHERATRRKVNTLSGFGTFAPITVSFDSPLDVENLRARHPDCANFRDDAVFLINLDPKSARFGEATCLDFGQGYFPVLTEPKPAEYRHEDPARDMDYHFFANDPRSRSSNLLFETVEEDLDCDGRLDPGEDTDQDGVLDHPNVSEPERFNPACADYSGDPFVEQDELVNFFEFETNTLLLRPVLPLEEKTAYAMVLTRRLTGRDGSPVRSPFPFVHHAVQGPALRPLESVLPRYGLGVEDVSFAWLFTTQDVRGDLAALRQGLYGSGPFSWLASRFPPELAVDLVKIPGDAENPYLLDASIVVSLLQGVLELPPVLRDLLLSLITPHPAPMVEAVVRSFENIDYILYGTFETPLLAPAPDGNFELDRSTGAARVDSDTVPFWLSVPRETPSLKPPFPVAIFGHGYTSCRTEMFLYMGNLARLGTASLSFDMTGHGCPLLSPEELENLKPVTSGLGIDHLLAAMSRTRSRDLNADGIPESGGDFWTADTFHTRDMVRQSALEIMRLIGILRSFDGTRTLGQDLNGDGSPEPAGDFNADGRVDVGGPQSSFFYWGQSLGGITAGLVAGAEPFLSAVVPVSGGGGLVDVAARSIQQGETEAVLLYINGPLIVGSAPTGSPVEVLFDVNDYYFERQLKFCTLPPLGPGDLVEVENLTNGEIRSGQVWQDRVLNAWGRPYYRVRFRVSIPADAGDRLVLRVMDGATLQEKARVEQFEQDVSFQGRLYEAGGPLASPASGYGLPRNTPDFRRLITLAQLILEPGDPVNYAPVCDDPYRGGNSEPARGTNLLVMNTVGDMNVPVSTGITLARAAGLIGISEPDPRYGAPAGKVLISRFVAEGIEDFRRFGNGAQGLFDVDDLDGDVQNYPDPPVPTLSPPLRLTRLREGGASGVRFAYLDPEGAHTFLGPSPWRPFDIERFLMNQIAWFFFTDGREILDDPCFADDSCSFYPPR